MEEWAYPLNRHNISLLCCHIIANAWRSLTSTLRLVLSTTVCRSWLERQQNCPTCRSPVEPPAEQAPAQAQGPRPVPRFAAAQEPAKKDQKDSSSDKKKVQFSKNLEMGPTGSPKVEDAKKEAKKDEPKSGPRTVQGVIIDDKKVGKGKAAKKGDKVEMRYIGKLKSNGKQFDGKSTFT